MPKLNQPIEPSYIERYRKLGWVILPTASNTAKWPGVHEWPKADPVYDEAIYEDRGIYLVTGERSGMSVIDIDTDTHREELLRLASLYGAPVATTPSGGLHIFVALAPDWGNTVRTVEGVDIRTTGGGVVIPDGSEGRSWIAPPWKHDLPDSEPFDTYLKAHVGTGESPEVDVSPSTLTEILQNPPRGSDSGRNNWLFDVAKYLSPRIEFEDAFRELILMVNGYLDVPLSDFEISRTVAQVWRRDHAREGTSGEWEIDWSTFWTEDLSIDWLVEPFIADGGQATHIYSKRGVGKSTFALYLAAGLATGRNPLTGAEIDPVTVAYVDLEMTKSDLWNNLRKFGYGPETDLSNLRYGMYPPFGKLEVIESGMRFIEWVDSFKPGLVVVDSITRTIVGSENDAETFGNLYDTSIGPLKDRGISSIWLGNTGKNKDMGSRGSSVKEDVMDFIWELKRHDLGSMFYCTKDRQGMAPEELLVVRSEEEGIIGYRTSTEGDFPRLDDRQQKLNDRLWELGVGRKAGRPACAEALRQAGETFNDHDLAQVIRYRKIAPDRSLGVAGQSRGVTHSGPHSYQPELGD